MIGWLRRGRVPVGSGVPAAREPQLVEPRPHGDLRLLTAVVWPLPTEQLVGRLYDYADTHDGTRRAVAAAEIGITLDNLGVRLNSWRARRATRHPGLLHTCRCDHARGAHLHGRWCLTRQCPCRRFVFRPRARHLHAVTPTSHPA